MLENEYRAKLVKSLLDCGLSQELATKTAREKSLWFLYKSKWTKEDCAFWNFNDKLKQAAEFLKISKSEYLRAALKHPQLFYQSVESIKHNVEGAAKLLGIPVKLYIKAALKRPTLLTSSPDTVYAHYVALTVAHKNGHIVSDDLIGDVLNNPVALVYSAKNTGLRDYHASLFGRTRTLGDFFRKKSKSVIEREIIECLTEKFKAGAAVAANEVRDLYAQGMISHVPASFEKTAAPA
jgi:hypothetical protein